MYIRLATESDIPEIFELHREVAQKSDGIARNLSEISIAYINKVYQEAQVSGIMLVGLHPETSQIIAEMHASKYGLQAFSHILTNITIVVHPFFQAQGLGKKLLGAFLTQLIENYPGIGRVELESRETNQKSINLYKSLGFELEGTMKNKTRNPDGTFEDSILLAWLNPNFKF